MTEPQEPDVDLDDVPRAELAEAQREIDGLDRGWKIANIAASHLRAERNAERESRFRWAEEAAHLETRLATQVGFPPDWERQIAACESSGAGVDLVKTWLTGETADPVPGNDRGHDVGADRWPFYSRSHRHGWRPSTTLTRTS